MSDYTFESGWMLRIPPSGGARLGGGAFAIAPECPKEPHGMRDCRCQSFRSQKAAIAYITSHPDKEGPTDE